jgi:hypothetical protein
MDRFLRLSWLLAALIYSPLLDATSALAQGAVGQVGPIVPGDPACWIQNGYVMDCGPASGGNQGLGIDQLLIQSRGGSTAPSMANGFGLGPFQNNGSGQFGSHFCDYAGSPQSQAGSYFLCFDPDTTANGISGGTISYGNIGVAPQLPLQICANGACVQFPFAGSGTGNVVSGSGTSVINQPVCFGNTTLTLIIACPGTGGGGGAPAANTVNTANASGVASFTKFLNLPQNPTLLATGTGLTGNQLSTLFVQGTTASATTPEFLASFGLTSNTGASGTIQKETLFTAMNATTGTGPVSAIVSQTTQGAGSGSYNADNLFSNLNNFDMDKGGADGPAGLNGINNINEAVSLTISGSNDINLFQNTAGIGIHSFGFSTNSGLYAHGLFTDGFYKFNAIADYSGSPTYQAIFGSHTYGLDFMQANISGGAVRLGSNNSSGIVGRNAAGTADAQLLTWTGTNEQICQINCSLVTSNAQVLAPSFVASVGMTIQSRPVPTGSGATNSCAIWTTSSNLGVTACGGLPPDGSTVVNNGGVLTAASGPSAQSITANTTTTTVSPGFTSQTNVLLTSNTTISILPGGTDSQLIKLRLAQDATGGRLVTFDSSVEFGTSVPSFTASTAANLVDFVGFEWDAGRGKWLVLAFAQGF